MTEEEEATAVSITRNFLAHYLSQLHRMAVGLNLRLTTLDVDSVMEHDWGQQLLRMAMYALDESQTDPSPEIARICHDLTSRLFHIPDLPPQQGGLYEPEAWQSSPMGQLWRLAKNKAQGNPLHTLADAARLTEVPLNTLAKRAARGTLHTYQHPLQQKRKLVDVSEIISH